MNVHSLSRCGKGDGESVGVGHPSRRPIPVVGIDVPAHRFASANSEQRLNFEFHPVIAGFGSELSQRFRELLVGPFATRAVMGCHYPGSRL